MLNLKTIALASALAFAPLSASFAQDTDKDLQPRARSMAESMWKKMADKDGMITQKQYMEMATKKWNEMDKGKTGKIGYKDAAQIMLFLSGMVGQQ